MAQSLLLAGIDLRPTDAPAAQRALRTLVTRLGRLGDPRVIFPEVYLRVTDRILEGLAEGRFLEAAWTSDLVGYFAELYFDAIGPWLSGERPACASWELAFAYAPEVMPVQAAVLGINAHINADLARVAARSIRNGDPTKLARYKRDYDLVNDILVECMPAVLGRLAAGHACPASGLATRSRLAERAAIGMAMPLIRAWRERAWNDAFRLLSSNAPADLAASFDRRAARDAHVLALTTRRPSTTPRTPVVAGLGAPARVYAAA
jgi:hypothetical protein